MSELQTSNRRHNESVVRYAAVAVVMLTAMIAAAITYLQVQPNVVGESLRRITESWGMGSNFVGVVLLAFVSSLAAAMIGLLVMGLATWVMPQRTQAEDKSDDRDMDIDSNVEMA